MSSTILLQFFLCGLLVIITVMHASAMPVDGPIQGAYANNPYYGSAMMHKRAINPFLDSVGKRSAMGGTRYPIFRPSSYRRPQRPLEDSLTQQMMLMN